MHRIIVCIKSKDLPLEVHGTSNIIVQSLRVLDKTVVVEPKILSILVANSRSQQSRGLD